MGMPEFLFLYRAPDGYQNSGEDIADWNEWLTGIGADLVDVGSPVAESSTVGSGASVVHLTGYSRVTAADRQTAEKIAARCPALASGGAVDVATLIDMPEGHGPRMGTVGMEYGSITSRVRIDASPDVVYEAISRPEHIKQWWTNDADLDPVPGGSGVLTWENRARTRPFTTPLTVVEAVPGKRFTFRWVYPHGEAPTSSNSMLVTFVLVPDGDGTLLTVTEEGMREQGWEAAQLEAYYNEHVAGWRRHLDDLAVYAVSFTTG